MAIHYIPTEYQKPKRSTLGLWAEKMQPMMQMFMQHQMQEDAWKKRHEMEQKARAKEQDKINFNRLREQGWQNAEEMGYGKEYMPSPTVVKQGIGLYKPNINRVDLPGGGFATMYGSKYLGTTKPKDPKFTYGTAYISDGKRKVPVFQDGKLFEKIDLGKVPIDEKLSEQQKSDIIEQRQKDIADYRKRLEKKKPGFDALLGKLQSLRKKRSDQEARITQMGYEYELTPSVKKARKMMDESIKKTENLMKKLYPDLWKDYQGKKTEVERRTYQERTLIKYSDGSIDYAD